MWSSCSPRSDSGSGTTRTPARFTSAREPGQGGPAWTEGSLGTVASKGQLRMSLLRWALVAVPAVVLLGFLSGTSAPAGDQSGWYRALAKPAATPPGWLFPVAWGVLYVLMGLALAIVLNARGARGRGAAIGLFAGQLLLNLAWTPVFFGMHRIGPALGLLAAIFVLALLATLAFGRIRSTAAWLMVPYLAWLCFAGALNARIWQLNGDGGLASGGATSQVLE
jgi:translocator protein